MEQKKAPDAGGEELGSKLLCLSSNAGGLAHAKSAIDSDPSNQGPHSSGIGLYMRYLYSGASCPVEAIL